MQFKKRNLNQLHSPFWRIHLLCSKCVLRCGSRASRICRLPELWRLGWPSVSARGSISKKNLHLWTLGSVSRVRRRSKYTVSLIREVLQLFLPTREELPCQIHHRWHLDFPDMNRSGRQEQWPGRPVHLFCSFLGEFRWCFVLRRILTGAKCHQRQFDLQCLE